MPLVSIIIPAYNAEKTIEKCIRSVLDQSFTDLECIVVDDGSNDNTASIIQNIEDPRLRYVHKENGGVSSTRNLGIAMAKGLYLSFLDADDIQTDQALSSLVSAMKINHADLVVAGFYRVVGDKIANKSYFKKECLLSRDAYVSKMSKKPAEYYFGVLWNKLYRRDIIINNDLTMHEDISWSEDFIFNLDYLKHINNVYILNTPVIYYYKTAGSLVNNNKDLLSRTIRMKLDVYRHYKKFLEELFPDDDGFLNDKYILFDSASDGGALFNKLGDEKIFINENVLQDRGYLASSYRHRKIAEKYLSVIAGRNNLSLNDIFVLSCLFDNVKLTTLDEFSDFLQMDKMKIRQSLMNLRFSKLIKYKENNETFRSIAITDNSLKIMDEIELARHEIESYVFMDLSEDEKMIYQKINQKIAKKEEKLL